MRTLDGTWRHDPSTRYIHLSPDLAYGWMRRQDTMCDDPNGTWSAFRGDPVGLEIEETAIRNLIARRGLEMAMTDFICTIEDNRERILASSDWNNTIERSIRCPISTCINVSQTRSIHWPAIISNLHLSCDRSVLMNLRIASEGRFLMIQFNPNLSIGFINDCCELIRTSCDIYIDSYTIARCIPLANNYDYAYIREVE